MSKIIRTEKPSVLPYYGLAAVWLVLGLALPLYKLSMLIVTALAGAAVFFWLKKICPPRVIEQEVAFNTGVGDVDAMLAAIQTQLDKLHRLNAELPDPKMTEAMNRMEKAGRGIVEAIEHDPQKAKEARRFANYYLPDAVDVLDRYAALARQGVRGENAAEIKAKVDQNAATIATAFENQLDALYAADSLNIDADVDVLQSMMKGQGLQ